MIGSVGKRQSPREEQSFFLPIRLLGFFAVCLPAITAYLCIISTFFTHADVISNYTLSNCPEVRSSLPPVSYAIGSWEPQKQMWMLAVIQHVPPRLIMIMMYPQIWREFIWRLALYTAAFLEMFFLVCVSLFYVDSVAGFFVHAACFGMWWGASIWGMSIIVHMQRVTGQIKQDPVIYRLWLAKIAIMSAFILVSCVVSISYPISQKFCSITAFTIFCLGEYAIIALNAAFWAVLLVEFNRDFDGFQVVSMSRSRANKDVLEHPSETSAVSYKSEQ